MARFISFESLTKKQRDFIVERGKVFGHTAREGRSLVMQSDAFQEAFDRYLHPADLLKVIEEEGGRFAPPPRQKPQRIAPSFA